MKIWQIAIVILLCLVVASVIACNPFSGEPAVTEQSVEVVRDDLAFTVSGSGNIKVSDEMNLSFGIAGKIDKIYVEEGDTVSKHEVLALLETDDLEMAVSEAKVAQTKAQVAVTEAQVAVQTAEYTLEQTEETYTLEDIEVAQSDVDEIRRDLEEALWTLRKYDPGTPGWEEQQKTVNQTKARLNTAEDTLDAILYGFDTEEVAIKKSQVELASQSLELTRQSLGLAEESLKQAERQLAKATITAPFTGVVAKVNVDEKDTVTAATTIVHLIDPSNMELEVEVDEIDVVEVKQGQKAIIEVDSLPALPLEGKVSFISLLPTEEAGVIVYNVKIEFNVPEGIGIRAGMSASADIVLSERSNVLLVPDRAIKQDNQGNTTVEVIVDGQSEERTVITGISDGFQTEIVDGLEEGEVVVGRR
ncbi:efflux RND transporter periplasmic adaptor subunit [Chloroflexota bacterium]